MLLKEHLVIVVDNRCVVLGRIVRPISRIEAVKLAIGVEMELADEVGLVSGR